MTEKKPRRISQHKWKVRFSLTLRYDPYASENFMVMVPRYYEGATKKDWNEAFENIYPEIEYFIETGISAIHQKKTERNTTKVKWVVFKRDGFTCLKCGSQDELEIDHIHPVSKGGSNEIENLQTLCKPCNRKKSNKT